MDDHDISITYDLHSPIIDDKVEVIEELVNEVYESQGTEIITQPQIANNALMEIMEEQTFLLRIIAVILLFLVFINLIKG